MIAVDHLAVSAATLVEAVAHVEETLGVAMGPGGVHVEMGTHNRLMGLGPGLYLEAIAINPDAASPNRARWFDLDARNGPAALTNWIVRTDDIEAALAAAPKGMGVPIPFSRDDLCWQMAVPGSGKLPFDSAAPALISWDTALHPADMLPDCGCRLRQLDIAHPQADALLEVFPALSTLAEVHISAGAQKAMAAQIETPHGMRVLR